MSKLQRVKSRMKNIFKNEDGNIAITFGLTLTVMLVGAGSAVDYASLSKAHKKSQSVADAAALHSAIFVKNHSRFPKNNDEGYMDGVSYSAAELGYDFNSSVEGGANNVFVTANYDDNAKEVTVRVTGKTVPTFMQMFGRERLPFSTESVVSYLDTEDKFPASIALVLDNSGSMQFDDKLAVNPYQYWGAWYGSEPAGAQIRLDGLKSSVNGFMSDLKSRLGNEDGSSRRTVRTGMLPYSSAIIASGVQNMSWGYISSGKINSMVANGGTNSSPPMSTARTWLQGEQTHHSNEAAAHGEEDKDALKFVIFMTDGQNTVGNTAFIPGNTGVWWKYSWRRGWRSRNSYRNGWTEGSFGLTTDSETLDSCTAMKNEGVTIFTIGYALEDHGPYLVNGWANYPSNRAYYIDSTAQAAANDLMLSCASSADHFIRATDAEALESAFDSIQNAIVEELIRIKS